MTTGWLKAALAASLAVNLLVAGMVAGALLGGGGDRAAGSRGGQHELRALSRGLPPERRAALRDALRDDDGFRSGRAELRAARAGVIVALTREPFDADGLREALAAQGTAQGAVVDRAFDALVAVVSEMDAAERAALAETLTARRGRPR